LTQEEMLWEHRPLVIVFTACVTSFHPTRNWWEGEEPVTDLASVTRSAKSIFFQAIILFTIFNAIILEFTACLAQNNMSQEQP